MDQDCGEEREAGGDGRGQNGKANRARERRQERGIGGQPDRIVSDARRTG
jgi:hypothetical protein